jgi:integrase
MALGKQAKTISDRQAKAVLNHLADARHPGRDRVVFLLSIKAGLRSKEIANLTWGMVTDSGGKIADVIAVRNVTSKGKNGGREIPVHSDLTDALAALQAHRGDLAAPDRPVIYSERGRGMSANSVTVWFHRLYAGLGMEGCSSHSGRRTFVTKAAHKIVEAGGSLRDVQQLAGHTSLATTQRYIEGSNDAKLKVIQMI